MSRAISTVLDVGVAIVLVGASVAVFAGVPSPAAEPERPVPSTGGDTIAGSTMTVQYERTDGQDVAVTGTVAGLLRDAAIARHESASEAYVGAVEESVTDRIDETGTATQLVGACAAGSGGDALPSANRSPVVAGPSPPSGQSVDATVYRWNESSAAGSADCDPIVVVRRWSA